MKLTLEAWSVRIRPEIKEKVKESAKKNFRSANAEFNRLLEVALKEEKNERT